MRTTLVALVVFWAFAAPAAADRAAADLQAVKKAVAASAGAQTSPSAEQPPAAGAEATPAPRKGEPRWFRVRVVEKSGTRARVKINLPLGLVRSLGDDWPLGIHHRCERENGQCLTLGEVLRALDSGQSLVEIDDDEATVRVWVE
jgi:hypothetical protein